VKSLNAKILLWCVGTLFFAFVAVTFGLSFLLPLADPKTPAPGPAPELQLAVSAYEAGGVPGLSQELDQLQREFRKKYYLIDTYGRDLVTGTDRSEFLTPLRHSQNRPSREEGSVDGLRVVVDESADGRYRLAGVRPTDQGIPRKEILAYYLGLITMILVTLYATIRIKVASPLRALAASVDRFGAGDFSIRVGSPRQDEIGDLGRSFDRMADRIETLRTAERRLLQDVSHELRTPLARMSFAAELARTAEDREAAIVRLKKEIDRLTELVGSLLQVTRVEGDSAAAIRLDDLLREVIDDCLVEAEAHGCAIDLDAAEVIVTGDRELFRRAIENVLRNAVRYTPPKSTVVVELENSRISIRDYGPGVPEEFLTKIFKPFYRVDDSRTQSTGGTGLGLAIAHRAIDLHRGRLWAENANPGLRVWIELNGTESPL
jgi:two-component system sensor histidine kinase CpxA